MLTLSHLQRALGGEITGGQLVAPGPGHSSADRSMAVRIAPDRPGGFVVHSHAGDDAMACRDYVKSRAGIDDTPSRRRMDDPKPRQAAPAGDDAEIRKQRAIAIWNESVDPRGTIVESYLRSRGLDIPPEMAMEVIRFHRSCPFGKGERHPCMIAAFHSIQTGELVAIHRTALTRDGRKIDRKMMGPVGGAAIKLESIAAGSKTIVTGEGIETCLSARAAGISPVWAMGSAEALARFPVLPGVETIGILGELDDSGANQKATQAVGDRWHASGREVHLFLPTAGKDLNDALQANGADAAVTVGTFEPTPKPPARDAVMSSTEPSDLIDDAGVVTQDWVTSIFAAEFGDRLRYCHHAGGWYEWAGSHWQRDQTDRAFHFVRELGRRMTAGAGQEEIKQVRRVSFASGVERFARADPAFSITSDRWDADEFLLGTPGGTVDLRTGKLRAADPADGITKVTAVAPADFVECPRWLQFLDETFGGDAEIARFAQQWAGYSLTGDTREHALVFGYGGGGNGKSVFLNVITGIMQDYAVTAAMETFIASNSERHPTDLAMLRGARMVTASETEEGRAWAESRLKQLTGGDKISARFMRQDFFEFRPNFKLTIVGNHRPVLKNIDEAARRRFNLLPFLLKPANPDRQLEEKLKAEWPGILRWMIAGSLDWQANGLIRPKSVIDATADYFAEQDLLGQWVDECCDADPGNSYKSDTIADLYASWADFAMKAGEDAGSKKMLSGLLIKRGFEKCTIGHDKARGFKGIRVKPKARQDRD